MRSKGSIKLYKKNNNMGYTVRINCTIYYTDYIPKCLL